VSSFFSILRRLKTKKEHFYVKQNNMYVNKQDIIQRASHTLVGYPCPSKLVYTHIQTRPSRIIARTSKHSLRDVKFHHKVYFITSVRGTLSHKRLHHPMFCIHYFGISTEMTLTSPY